MNYYKARVGDKVPVYASEFQLNRSLDFIFYYILKDKEMVKDYLELRPKDFIKKYSQVKFDNAKDT